MAEVVHLHIRVNGEQVKVPDDYRTVPFDPAAGPVANVAAVYQEIAQSIAEGRRPHPDFHTAAAHHRVLAAIERAAETGADTDPTVDGTMFGTNSIHHVRDGQVISLGTPRAGLRTYLAVRGGVCVTPVLGSRSYDVMSEI